MFRSKLEMAVFVLYLIVVFFGMTAFIHIMGYDLITGASISNN
jgi:hypothetical protein